MKTWLKLTFVCLFLASANLGYSKLQSQGSENFSPEKTMVKHYVGFDRIHFSEKGIFLEDNRSRLLQIENLHFDKQGYYITDFWDLFFPKVDYVVACKSCGYEYQNRSPQPCEKCELSLGFDVVYTGDDMWNR